MRTIYIRELQDRNVNLSLYAIQICSQAAFAARYGDSESLELADEVKTILPTISCFSKVRQFIRPEQFLSIIALGYLIDSLTLVSEAK